MRNKIPFIIGKENLQSRNQLKEEQIKGHWDE